MSKWEKVKLGEVCTINPPKKLLQSFYENKLVSFIPMSEVSEDGKVNTGIKKLYSEVNTGFTYFAENDVLFAKITPCMENGKGGVARGLINGLGVGSTEFHVLRPNETVTSDWIHRFLSYSNFRKLAEINMTGSGGQRRVPKAFLESVFIPLPPLETQKQIANTLDTAAVLLTMRKQQLTELDSLIKSIFYDMFGDPLANEKGWMFTTLKEVCNKITDGTHHSPENLEIGEYKYITAKNIKRDGFDFKNLTYVDEMTHKQIYSRCNPEFGDILYIKDGVTTGVAQINTLNEEFSMLSSVALLKLKIEVINAYYLREVLNNKEMYTNIRIKMGGAAITRLTIKKIEAILIPLPPLELQAKFANIVTKIEEQKSIVKQAIDETQHLFDSLMSEYFE